MSERRPVSDLGWRILDRVHAAGGSITLAALEHVTSSPRALLGALGHLESRFLVRLRPGRVLLTPSGFRICSRRSAH